MANDIMYDKIVIGLDQSYERTGICVLADKQKKKLGSISLSQYDSNTSRRNVLRTELYNALNKVTPRAAETICIIERIRLHSQGFLNMDYIKSIGALSALIVDTCSEFDVDVYSVDTRAWKARVIGTSKPMSNDYGIPPEKWPTILWCNKMGWNKDIIIELPRGTRRTKGVFEHNGKLYVYDNDAADAAGIAMFGFAGFDDLLTLEH